MLCASWVPCEAAGLVQVKKKKIIYFNSSLFVRIGKYYQGFTLNLFNTLTLNFIHNMKNNLTLLNLANVLVIIIPMLLGVAFMTIIERKQLAAHQRRVGPQVTGYWGVLQP